MKRFIHYLLISISILFLSTIWVAPSSVLASESSTLVEAPAILHMDERSSQIQDDAVEQQASKDTETTAKVIQDPEDALDHMVKSIELEDDGDLDPEIPIDEASEMTASTPTEIDAGAEGSPDEDAPGIIETDESEFNPSDSKDNPAQEDIPSSYIPSDDEGHLTPDETPSIDDENKLEESFTSEEDLPSDYLVEPQEAKRAEIDPAPEMRTDAVEEGLPQEITPNSLTTISTALAPQFRVEVLDGHLVLRDLSSGEIRKDNKWVVDSYTNKMYFPNTQGHLYRDRFITFGPQIAYYMGQDGSKLSNQVIEVNNRLHLLNQDGMLNRSNKWAQLNNKDYFPNAEGTLYRNRFITFGPQVAYYMGQDGSKLSNQVIEVNNRLHLLNQDGMLNRSNKWTRLNGKDYFPNAEGTLYRNRFITFGSQTAYYMGQDGSKLSNQVIEVNNRLHLLNQDGMLNRSNKWTQLNKKDYFPNAEGTLYRNRFITFGPKAAYYLDNSGAKVTGQFEVNGIPYTFDSAGLFLPTHKGWKTIKNNLYHFAPNGFPTTGWFNVAEKTYHADSTGIISKGLKTIGQNVHYFDLRTQVPYPNMVRNEKLSFGGTFYFFNQDGIGIRLSSANLGSMQDGLYLTNNNYLLTVKNGMATIDGTLIVNKTFTLPSTYNPGLTYATQQAYNSMKNDMISKGMDLWITSGFRSYATQSALFQQYANNYGVAQAETFSARAGHSEHQSGLAMDLNIIDDAFAYTREGNWLHNNAWRYGFILRYPQSKQSITGYIYEPWHFRYVGTSLAKDLYNNGNWLTIEEHFGIPSKYR